MGTDTNRGDRVRALFREAHLAQERVDVGELWQTRVMAHIEEMASEGERPDFLCAFEQFVWRLLPFALVTTLALAAVLAGLYATTEYNGLQLFAYHMEELTIEQVFGA
jgi:hypothetical protein